MGSLSFLRRAFELPFWVSLAAAPWMSSQKGFQPAHLLSFQALPPCTHTKYGQIPGPFWEVVWFDFHLRFLRFGRKLSRVYLTPLVGRGNLSAVRPPALWLDWHSELHHLWLREPVVGGGLATQYRRTHADISLELPDEVGALRFCLVIVYRLGNHHVWQPIINVLKLFEVNKTFRLKKKANKKTFDYSSPSHLLGKATLGSNLPGALFPLHKIHFPP